MKFTEEQIAKMKAATSAEELLALAKESGVELTEEQANVYFNELHKNGELADEELNNVAGGCGKPYTDIYCHKCGWTTKWNGYYPILRGDGEVQKYAGPCPDCGAEYIYAGAYHG